MKNFFKLFAAAAAAVLLSAPVFAQAQHEAGTCPHHQATEKAMSQALALLNQAKAQNGDQAKATLEKARLQLAEAQKHMAACEGTCQAEGQDHSAHSATPAPAAAGEAQASLVTDPFCGMRIDPKAAAAKTVYKGKTYYFCAKDEKEMFDKDPEKYLKQNY